MRLNVSLHHLLGFIMLFIYLALAPLLTLISVIFYRFPPKSINSMYGYRSKRSMASEKAWDFANELSCRLMLWGCIVLNLVQAIAFIFFDVETAALITVAIMVLGLLLIFPIVESRLKDLDLPESRKLEI